MTLAPAMRTMLEDIKPDALLALHSIIWQLHMASIHARMAVFVAPEHLVTLPLVWPLP